MLRFSGAFANEIKIKLTRNQSAWTPSV